MPPEQLPTWTLSAVTVHASSGFMPQVHLSPKPSAQRETGSGGAPVVGVGAGRGGIRCAAYRFPVSSPQRQALLHTQAPPGLTHVPRERSSSVLSMTCHLFAMLGCFQTFYCFNLSLALLLFNYRLMSAQGSILVVGRDGGGGSRRGKYLDTKSLSL